MPPSFFQSRRRRKSSYFLLDDDHEEYIRDDSNKYPETSGKMALVPSASSGETSICRFKMFTAEGTTPTEAANCNPKLSLELARELQVNYTFWPSSIWDVNFNDVCDGEIVFETDDGCVIVAEEECPSQLKSSKKSSQMAMSVDTLDTEDETMPLSCCSPPEFHNTWELDALDLSVILDEESLSVEEVVLESRHEIEEDESNDSVSLPSPIQANPEWRHEDVRDHCALLACSRDLRNMFFTHDSPTKTPQQRPSSIVTGTFVSPSTSGSQTTLQSSSSDSPHSPFSQIPALNRYFEIEESFGMPHNANNISLSPMDPRKVPKQRSICFADEAGYPMETVHMVDRHDDDDENYDPSRQRLLILCLSPSDRKFEFVHANFSLHSRVSVASVLQQLPLFVSDSVIQAQNYTRLCKANGGTELINALSLHDYELVPDEILVAVLENYSSPVMHRMAEGLIANDEIIKAVMRTTSGSHTLHRILSNDEVHERSRHLRERNLLARKLSYEEESLQLVDWKGLSPTHKDNVRNNTDSTLSLSTFPQHIQDNDRGSAYPMEFGLVDSQRDAACTLDANEEDRDCPSTDHGIFSSPVFSSPGTGSNMSSPLKRKTQLERSSAQSPPTKQSLGKLSPSKFTPSKLSPRLKSRQSKHKRALQPISLGRQDGSPQTTSPKKISVVNQDESSVLPTKLEKHPRTNLQDNRSYDSAEQKRNNRFQFSLRFRTDKSKRRGLESGSSASWIKRNKALQATAIANLPDLPEETAKTSAPAQRKPNWASRFAKKRWSNLKVIGKRKQVD